VRASAPSAPGPSSLADVARPAQETYGQGPHQHTPKQHAKRSAWNTAPSNAELRRQVKAEEEQRKAAEMVAAAEEVLSKEEPDPQIVAEAGDILDSLYD